MSRNILITFAGRENRMAILNNYVRQALNLGIIDEWHIWDFTRNASDRDYIRKNYGPIRYIGENAGYQRQGNLKRNSSLRLKARITNDLHLAFSIGNQCFIEFVAGGWENSRSVIRTINQSAFSIQERSDPRCHHVEETPSLLWGNGMDNTISLAIDDKGILYVSINDYAFPPVPLPCASDDYEFYIRGGWGASLELPDSQSPIRQYIGIAPEDYPYFQSYQFYATRFNEYRDDIFLKCDDDIVYMDVDKLGDFIDFRRHHQDYFIVSANVLNNGICAHLQQKGGSLPSEIGEFEAPLHGFGGTLWKSGEKAEKLHNFFLNNNTPTLNLPTLIVEWHERNSINFIAWRGEDLRYMFFPRIDDEHALTIAIPKYTRRKTAIYSDFMVAHLSFGPQESTINTEFLLKRYKALMNKNLALTKPSCAA